MKPEDPIDVDTDFSDEDMLDQDIQDDGADTDFDYEDGEENWDEAEDSGSPVAKPKKKKSSLFTILLIGGAVLIGGGIFLTQFGGTKGGGNVAIPPSQEQAALPATTDTAAPPAANDLTALQDGQTIAPSPAPTPAPVTQNQGFMNQPEVLDQADSANINDNPAPALPEQPSMTGFDAPPAALPAPGDTAPTDVASQPLPVANENANLPNIDMIKKAETAPPVAAPVTAPVAAPAPAVVAPAPVIEPKPVTTAQTIVTTEPTAREIELQAKLDAAISRISALEKKLADVSAAPAVSATSSGASADEIASLRADVERLENKFSRITVTPAARSYADEAEPAPVVKKAAPKKKKKTYVIPKQSPSDSYSAYSPPKQQTGQWELRSARPGEAMVAKRGQADLKTIRVGDSVVGIGQIKSISQVGGVWVVQGTAGSIAQ